MCVRQCGKYCEISAEAAAPRGPKEEAIKKKRVLVSEGATQWERAELGAWHRQSGLTGKQEWQLLPSQCQRRALGIGMGFFFWISACQNLGLHPQLVQPLVLNETQFSATESPLWLGESLTSWLPHQPAKRKNVSRRNKITQWNPCNKCLRCKKITKWNGVRHESEICLF